MKTTKQTPTPMTLDALLANARRLGKEAQHVAWSARMLGLDAASLCCWCADKPGYLDRHAHRLPRGGECEHCSYHGHDALVVGSIAG